MDTHESPEPIEPTDPLVSLYGVKLSAFLGRVLSAGRVSKSHQIVTPEDKEPFDWPHMPTLHQKRTMAARPFTTKR
jgi:hypothetical protein